MITIAGRRESEPFKTSCQKGSVPHMAKKGTLRAKVALKTQGTTSP